MTTDPSPDLAVHPLTPDRWPDLERLFGSRGATGGCWCMYWRLPRSTFDQQKGEGNRRAFRGVVEEAGPPGVLGYVEGEPVAWCAVAPREDYPALGRSRILKPVDDRPVWSISCLFVAKAHRRSGLTARMIAAAAEWAGTRGARIVEGYPVEPRKGEMPAAFAWTGIASAFLAAGFREVARRSETRPIMRLELDGP